MSTHLGPKFLGDIGESRGVCGGIGRNPPKASFTGFLPLSNVVVPVLLLSMVSAKLERLMDAHPDNEKGLLGVLLLCCWFPEMLGEGSGVLESFFFFFLKNIDSTP